VRKLLLLIPPLCLACSSDEQSKLADSPGDSADSAPPAERQVPPSTYLDAPARLVAFGDVHGDLEASRAVLQLVGAIDENDSWVGGELVVVQTGDQIDRGADDRAVLDLFEELAEQAFAAGGALYSLVGNHEIMNVELDLRYIHDDAWASFDDIPYDPKDPDLADLDEEQYGRAAAFKPGGPYALMLAGRNTSMVVGDTAFVHGGILPEPAADGIDTINAAVQAWMRGEGEEPDQVQGDESLVWSRHYSQDPDSQDCKDLAAALAVLGAQRMVVGHTVHDTANPACDDMVWRIDVGMSDYYGGEPAALEIVGDEVTAIE